MPQTYQEAEDIILGIITTAWDSAPAVALHGGAPLFYENIDEKRPDSSATADQPRLFARATIQYLGSERASLGPTGNNGAKFRRAGTTFVQLFINQGEALDELNALGDLMVNTFEDLDAAAAQDVRFFNIGSVKLGSDGSYFQVNVQADFNWDRTS